MIRKERKKERRGGIEKREEGRNSLLCNEQHAFLDVALIAIEFLEKKLPIRFFPTGRTFTERGMHAVIERRKYFEDRYFLEKKLSSSLVHTWSCTHC